MKICFLPGREGAYSRNRVLKAAMKSAGIEVLDCSSPQKSPLRYLISFSRFLKYQKECDAVLVGFLGHFFMPFVKLFTRKKVLFDVFISVYQTLAFDRKSIKPHGALAAAARWLDKTACRLADHVFCDTQQHIDYFVKEYGLSKEKFSRLFVGSDESVMCPRPSLKEKNFLVHFHGEFQALHGVEHIVEAAGLLPEIQFQLIGEGATRQFCMQKAKDLSLKNIRFIPFVLYEQLPEYMARASVCLGIFGDTIKAQMVIPHKVFEALAMGKPLITSATPAAREFLTDRENVIFCKPADAKSLAEAIGNLREDSALRRSIADNGYKLFQNQCSPDVLGKKIRDIAVKMISLKQGTKV